MEKLRLFTVGPVNMFEYTLQLSGIQIPYFRTREFSKIVFDIEKNMAELLGASAGTRIALLTASGSGAMESVVQTLDSTKKVLIVNGGSFGERFVKLCELHKIPHDVVLLPFAEDLTAEVFNAYSDCNYQALLVNIHETSIGKYYSPSVLKNFCANNGCFLIVDAISSFLADTYNMDELGADVTIVSSQKALALSPGLSAVAVGAAYFDACIKNADSPACAYLDLRDAFVDAERGQTPFTPALSVIYQLQQRLQKIQASGGVGGEICRVKALADYFRKEIVKIGYGIPSYRLSDCLTPILCPKNNAVELFERCKDKYNVYLTPCGGANSDSLLRIGHIGDLRIKDIDFLLNILSGERE